MGKRSREKKLQKIEEDRLEKEMIEARKKTRLEPTIRYLRKFVITAVATVLLLWLGSFITHHISTIVGKLKT